MSKALSKTQAIVTIIVIIVAGTAGYYLGLQSPITPRQPESKVVTQMVTQTVERTVTRTETQIVKPAAPKVVTILQTRFEVPWLDPITCPGNCENVTPATYETLVTWDVKLKDYTKVVPHLAESFDVSPDGKVYTFKLRRGITTHLGNELTAESVKFSFDRLFDPNFKIPFAPGKQLYTSVVGAYTDPSLVKVLDKYTIQITLKSPNASFLLVLSQRWLGIIDPAVMKFQKETDWGAQWMSEGNSAGSGPYMVQEFKPGEILVLKKFDKYWKGIPKIDKLVWRVIKEPTVQRLMLERGEAHIAQDLTVDDIKALTGKQGIKVVFGASQTAFGINFNANTSTSPAPLRDYRVRLALAHLVDYEGIIKNILGTGEPMYGVFNKPRLGWDAWGGEPPIKFDVEKAKKLLAEAGYPNGFTLKFFHYQQGLGGQPFEDMAVKIKSDFAKAGVTAELETGPVTVIEQKRNERQYDLFFAWNGWTNNDPDGSANFALFRFKTISGYTDKLADQLREKAAALVDREARATVYREFNKEVWFKNLYAYWYIHVFRGTAVSEKLTGWYFTEGIANGFGAHFYDLDLAT